jgi:hypothetical protein
VKRAVEIIHAWVCVLDAFMEQSLVPRRKTLTDGGSGGAVVAGRLEPQWGQTPERSAAIDTVEPGLPGLAVAHGVMRTQAVTFRTQLMPLRGGGPLAVIRFPHGAVSFKRGGSGDDLVDQYRVR